MSMTLEELNDHIVRVRAALEAKKRELDHMFATTPTTGAMLSYQIECLEPRLAELERHALRLTKERAAAEATATPV